MSLRLCTYNIEWFDKAFTDDNRLSADAESEEQLAAIREVITHIDPDIIGIVEAPNHSASTGKSTVACLETFAQEAGLRVNEALMGFPSPGRQELAILFDPQKLSAEHEPGGEEGNTARPRFDEEFRADTDDDRIKEVYKHYRPPLEVKLTRQDGGPELHLMVVHCKSKGIFSNTDRLHWLRETERNRRKLFAEAISIRQRVDEWLDLGRGMVVMGDINDGPGMDFYERRFGRSAVEVVMGDLFDPDRILRSQIGRPTWGRFGWEPSSTRFTDIFTNDPVNALIDHILVSRDVATVGDGAHQIWNPFQLAAAEPLKATLFKASDHFPVTLDIA